LLQLCVFQVIAHHHFENKEEFSIRDEVVSVHVVYFEGKPKLLFTPSATAEGAQATNKFFEIDSSSSTVKKKRLEMQSKPMGDENKKTYSESKMAIMRLARGLLAIWGIFKNSSRSIEPDPSLNSGMSAFHTGGVWQVRLTHRA